MGEYVAHIGYCCQGAGGKHIVGACPSHCTAVGWNDHNRNIEAVTGYVVELVPALGVLIIDQCATRHVNWDVMVNSIKGIGAYGWRYFSMAYY